MYEKYFVYQTSSNDCGAACLTMILKLFGKKVTLEDIKNNIKIDKEGTSFYDIISTAKKYDLEATGYKFLDMEETKTPFIAHIINNNIQHFIVVLKVYKDKILIADPAKGILNMKKEYFNSLYTKVGIVFKKQDKNILFKVNKKIILKYIFLVIIYVLLNILVSFFISYLFSLYEANNSNLSYFLFLILFILSISKRLFLYLRGVVSQNLQLIIDKDITISILKKLFYLPYDFYKTNGPGGLVSKINDLSYIKEFYFKIIDVFIINLLLIIVSFIILIFVDFKLFIINCIYFILLYSLNLSFCKDNLYENYDLQLSSEKLNNKIVDSLKNILLIKSLNKEKYYVNTVIKKYNLFQKKIKILLKKYLIKDFYISIFSILNMFLCILILLINKSMASHIILIYSLINIVISSLTEIFSLSNLWLEYKGSFKRIEEIKNIKLKKERKSYFNIESIKFNNVSYSYDDIRILNNVSFNINKGDFVMITGKSGSGKSTLFKILTKDLNYDKDSILVNNITLNNINKNIIQDNILYIDQNSKLINGSIYENIFMGDKVDNLILKTTLLDKILEEKNNNINYKIDSINSNLSGGQISKVLIAQALNSKRQVLIFDETTISLDEDEEKIILENIKKNYKNKTIILITHRKSNLNLFDKIIEI